MTLFSQAICDMTMRIMAAVILFVSVFLFLPASAEMAFGQDYNAVYLKDIGPVRMSVDPDWYPYERINESGEYEGIAADLIRLIAGRSGVSLELLPSEDWQESLEFSKAGSAQILAFLNRTPERESWLIFTEPYFTDPNVFITRQEHDFISDPSRLSGERIVFPAGTSLEEYVRGRYPNLEVLIVETEAEAFRMVEEKKADMTLRSLTMAAFTIRQEGWFNLKISGQLPDFANEFRIGVSRELPLLRDILNEGIRTISPQEVEAIVSSHISINAQTVTNYRLLFGLLLFFLIASLFVFYRTVQMKQHSDHLRLIIDTVPAYIFARDGEGRFILANKAVADLFGTTTDQVVGKRDSDYGADRELYTDYLTADATVLKSGKPLLIPEEQVMRPDRTLGWFRTVKIPYRYPGSRRPAVLGVALDITENKEAEELMRRMAQYDILTKLPNRSLFSDRLGQALALARREQSGLSVMFVDLDGFKPVNDTYGHAVGDILLQQVAERLLAGVRSSDTVGRIGGDEFVILLGQVRETSGALAAGEKIRNSLNEPFLIDDLSVSISASIGFSLFPEDGTGETELFRHADEAMYRSKREGKNRVRGYGSIVPDRQ